MKELHLFVILLALQCTLHFAKAVQIGFGETDYDVLEGEGEVRLLLTKLEATTENITVRVSLVTLEELEALGREIETQVEIDDPAEYSLDPTGRRDFVRSGPVEITFLPSQDSQDQTFIVPIVTDNINEADEAFFAVLEPVDILDPTREITLREGGVTRINIRDDDSIAFGFERPEYTFPEEDLTVDDTVFVISNGVESEQVLEVFSLASSAGFSQEGEDFIIDDRIALTFNPGVGRQVVPFRILADDVSEGLESFNMALSISDDVSGLRLDLSRAGTTIFIDDDDNTTIGFETTTLVVREDEGSVQICVRAIAPDEFTVRVIATVVTEDGDAVAGEDFEFESRNLALSQEESNRRRCVNIPIIDDDEFEPNETFRVILERNPRLTASNIEFNTTTITVVIEDDDNPCLDGTHTCDVNADCETNEGSFTCTCRARFTGDGFTCQSIDECTTSDQCHSQAECVIQDSGNECECSSGFQGDGLVCDDINECLTDQDDCVPNADCINTEGSFMCQCHDGFEGADCSPVATQAEVEPTTQAVTTPATTPTIATTTQAMTTRKPFPIPSIWRPGLPIRPRPPRPPMRPRPRPRPNPMPRPTVSAPEPEPLPPCSDIAMDVDDDDEDTTASRSTSRSRSTRRRGKRWGRYLYRWKIAKAKFSKSRSTGTKSSAGTKSRAAMCNPAESSRSTSRRSNTSYTRSSSSKSTKYSKSSSSSHSTKSSSHSTKYTKSSSTSYSKSTKRG